jgi:hypothetical protein
MVDAEVQTEALEKEPENNEDEEVLGWRVFKATFLFLK